MNCKLVPPLLALLVSSAFPAILAGEEPVEPGVKAIKSIF